MTSLLNNTRIIERAESLRSTMDDASKNLKKQAENIDTQLHTSTQAIQLKAIDLADYARRARDIGQALVNEAERLERFVAVLQDDVSRRSIS